jgi:hypothetical protein
MHEFLFVSREDFMHEYEDHNISINFTFYYLSLSLAAYLSYLLFQDSLCKQYTL